MKNLIKRFLFSLIIVTCTITLFACKPLDNANNNVVVAEHIIVKDIESSIIGSSGFELTINQTKTLTAVVVPSNATNKAINWLSEDITIAKVSITGVVTAVDKGTTFIVARCGNVETKIQVIVVEQHIHKYNNIQKLVTKTTTSGNTSSTKAYWANYCSCGDSYEITSGELGEVIPIGQENGSTINTTVATALFYGSLRSSSTNSKKFISLNQNINIATNIEDFEGLNYINPEVYIIGNGYTITVEGLNSFDAAFIFSNNFYAQDLSIVAGSNINQAIVGDSGDDDYENEMPELSSAFCYFRSAEDIASYNSLINTLTLKNCTITGFDYAIYQPITYTYIDDYNYDEIGIPYVLNIDLQNCTFIENNLSAIYSESLNSLSVHNCDFISVGNSINHYSSAIDINQCAKPHSNSTNTQCYINIANSRFSNCGDRLPNSEGSAINLCQRLNGDNYLSDFATLQSEFEEYLVSDLYITNGTLTDVAIANCVFSNSNATTRDISIGRSFEGASSNYSTSDFSIKISNCVGSGTNGSIKFNDFGKGFSESLLKNKIYTSNLTNLPSNYLSLPNYSNLNFEEAYLLEYIEILDNIILFKIEKAYDSTLSKWVLKNFELAEISELEIEELDSFNDISYENYIIAGDLVAELEDNSNGMLICTNFSYIDWDPYIVNDFEDFEYNGETLFTAGEVDIILLNLNIDLSEFEEFGSIPLYSDSGTKTLIGGMANDFNMFFVNKSFTRTITAPDKSFISEGLFNIDNINVTFRNITFEGSESSLEFDTDNFNEIEDNYCILLNNDSDDIMSASFINCTFNNFVYAISDMYLMAANHIDYLIDGCVFNNSMCAIKVSNINDMIITNSEFNNIGGKFYHIIDEENKEVCYADNMFAIEINAVIDLNSLEISNCIFNNCGNVAGSGKNGVINIKARSAFDSAAVFINNDVFTAVISNDDPDTTDITEGVAIKDNNFTTTTPENTNYNLISVGTKPDFEIVITTEIEDDIENTIYTLIEHVNNNKYIVVAAGSDFEDIKLFYLMSISEIGNLEAENYDDLIVEYLAIIKAMFENDEIDDPIIPNNNFTDNFEIIISGNSSINIYNYVSDNISNLTADEETIYNSSNE